ncbi:40-residue YVTN family beta-propeller repeat-containing protein [Streptomyces misionensis]|uniref:40-residue YVTN family beta-propeller repeat-containing protein n=1 Tax=Streptomyces misionensis TaxID=67331 RepID=A0A1H5H6H2_9ACTN|nr:IPT/TIG domain-containing protein [Streptomyces misionensis]SEE23539.1 40-residue YVTN family beta-propeller repeat-containing protein [Streptomyces misionensis]
MAPTTVHTAIRPGRLRRLRRGAAGALATALLGTAAALLPAVPAHAAAPAQLVYVANSDSDSVTVYDPATGAKVTDVMVGSQPRSVALSPDGTQAYVTDYAGGAITVIDTATNTAVDAFAVGAAPTPVAFSPDGAHAYVGLTGSPGQVAVIDTATRTVTATVPVGGQPFALQVRPDGGRVYVADFVKNVVEVIDTATNTLAATIAEPAGARSPTGLAVSPDGASVYVTNYNSRNVTVIDAGSYLVTALVPVGAQPFGVAVTPDGGSVYVANMSSGSVSVLDAATNTVTATVPVGVRPFGVTADPEGGAVYVANNTSNTVSTISTATNTVTATVSAGLAPFGLAVSKPAPPKVTGLAPGHGPVAGSTTITLTGSHLSGTTAVSFDGTPAANVTVVDDSTVTAAAPAHAAGTVDVTLSARGRTVPAGQYTYEDPAPVLSGLAPATGPAAGGTVVTLTGSHFTGATAVNFGTVPATSFTVVDDSTITATAPAAAAAGPVDVSVTTPAGTSATGATDRYTYTKDTAKLTANPLLLSIGPGQLSVNLNLSAALTDTTTGKAVPGATVTFKVGATTVCTAITNAAGTASCTGPCPVAAVLLNLGYTATYAGDPAHEAATATAGLIRIG